MINGFRTGQEFLGTDLRVQFEAPERAKAQVIASKQLGQSGGALAQGAAAK